MRHVRCGGALLVMLLAGCQASGQANPSRSATSSPSPMPSASTHAVLTPPSLQAVNNRYNPLYCGVQAATAGQPANVLLTIDDFPYQNGEEMITIARWAKQTGTMMEAFPISGPVEAYDRAHHTDLVASTRALGTYVGNHTYSHPNLRNLPLTQAEREIARGITSTYVRPPYGAYNHAVQSFVEQDVHARICYWTIDTGDWERLKNGAYPPVSTLLSRVRAQLKQAKPGVPVVILGHYHTNYPKALPGIRSLVAQQTNLRICPAPLGATTAKVPYPIC